MTFLSGDLGGTKTLISIYGDNDNFKKLHQHKYISQEWNSLEDIIYHFLGNLPSNISPPTSGCVGVAGRVINGKSTITNLSWDLNEDQICAKLGLNKFKLENDFSVLIHSLPFLKRNQYKEIQTSNRENPRGSMVAIIGAGTGLGIARGFISKNQTIVLPSEGGHREFSPRSEEEWQIAQWVKKELNLKRLSLERIVSGRGLGLIAKWRLSLADVKNHPLKTISTAWNPISAQEYDLPALASQLAQNGDKIMKEVLEIWLSAYGSTVGDLALQELCYGGLWIAGGTAKKNLTGLSSKTFKNAMLNKGRFKEFVEELPVRVITDSEAGLFGAACCARLMIKSDGRLNSIGKN